jgi:hypothetical protein
MTMISRKRSWTFDDDARLRALIKQGGSPSRATVMLKRSEQAVRTRAADLGLQFATIKERRARAEGAIPVPPAHRHLG